MTARRRAARVLCAAALLVPLAGCGGVSLQNLPKFSEGIGPSYEVRATFTEVLNLPSDAQVRLGPQVVGQVGDIATRDFRAELVLKIKDGVQLPVGTTAQVRFDNPLGDQYVLLTLPAQPGTRVLGPGEPLAQQDTSSAASVEDAFAALSAVLNGGGISQLQTIIREFNATFDGNQEQVRQLLTQVDTAVTNLAQGRQTVVDALTAIDDLSRQLGAGSATITAGITELAPAIGVLAQENAELSNLLTNFDQLSVVANRVLRESGQNSVEGVRALLPVLDQLVGVRESIGEDLRDLAELSRSTAGKVPSDYLQVGLTLGIDLPDGAFAPGSPAAVAPPPDPVRQSSSDSSEAVKSLIQKGLS